MVRKILFLASNPGNTSRLRLEKEYREIGEGLRRSNRRDQFELVAALAVRANDLRRSLLDHSPRIVHFAGHDGAGGIVVEDEQGQAVQIPDDALATLFELCAQQIDCVILNACCSDAQATAIAKHVPYVIGMNSSVSDDAAIEFAVGFYDALGAGKSIEDGFKLGCNAIALKGIPEHLTPVLRKHLLTPPERERLESTYCPAPDVHMDVSVMNLDASSWNRGEDTILLYSIGRDPTRITIQDELGYSRLFETGGPIAPLNYMTLCPFKWDFPVLDLKVLNRKQESIFLTEVILEVEQSYPLSTPLFAIRRDSLQGFAGELHLVNEGWCDVADMTIAFHLLPGQRPDLRFEPPFPHSIAVANLKDRAEVEVLDAFRKEGVDIDGLLRFGGGRWDGESFVCPAADGSEERFTNPELVEREKVYLGRFHEEVGTLSGEISYATEEGAPKRHTVKFIALVYLANKNRLGVQRPPSFAYDSALEVQGAGYEKRVQISQTLQPGEADRFTIRVGVAQSSFHRFRITLRDVTGATLRSLPIEMRCFVPRSQSATVQRRILGQQK
jgi:hypothetical protein